MLCMVVTSVCLMLAKIMPIVKLGAMPVRARAFFRNFDYIFCKINILWYCFKMDASLAMLGCYLQLVVLHCLPCLVLYML